MRIGSFHNPPLPLLEKRGQYLLALFLGLTALVGFAGCGVQQLSRWPGGRFRPPRSATRVSRSTNPPRRAGPWAPPCSWRNPNNQALNLVGYDYQLWIEGKSVAQGAGQQPVNLPPNGQTVAELPIMVQLPAVMELLPQFLPQFLGQQQQQMPLRKFHYQIAGSFRLASVLGGIIPLPFRFQGEASPQEGHGFPEALPALTLRLGRNRRISPRL